MRNLQFKYAKAENFICFGSEGIELKFENYGNIVLIRGRILDQQEDEDDKTSSNGSGKCFGINTPILMFDGTTKLVQDIKVGDLVMGNNSTPRRVLSLGRGRETLYRVLPVKGNSYIVNESHILSLKARGTKGRSYKKGEIKNVSVRDYCSATNTFRHMMGGYRSGVDFPYQEVSIDPYFLGVWLGDGTKSNTGVTNADKEIIECIYDEAKKRCLHVTVHYHNNCGTYVQSASCSKPGKDAILAYEIWQTVKNKPRNRGYNRYTEVAKAISFSLPDNNIPSISSIWRWIKKVKNWILVGNKLEKVTGNINREELDSMKYRNTLLNDLRKYNLINNKHIPYEYKVNNRQIRLQVLAGLIDTDGSNGNNCYDFVNKSQQLAEDVVFLARSLGLAAYIQPCRKRCQTGVVGTYYRVCISGHCDEIPVRLTNKKCHPRRINKDPLSVGIKVQPIGEGDYYGFAVDGNHLFLLGDFTVVHNSSIPEVITYALYGKTIKKPKKIGHKDVINNKCTGKLRVEVLWDNYRVVRTRQATKSNDKGTLQLWESDKGEWTEDTEITKGGMPATQKLIEEKIGLSYEAFVNIVIFTDDSNSAFLECDTIEKRQIVENLLSLEKYKDYSDNSKRLLKECKDRVKTLTKEYELLLASKDTINKRVEQINHQEQEWKVARLNEIKTLLSQAKSKKELLENTDGGTALIQYQEAQEKIKHLAEVINDLEAKQKKAADYISQSKKNYDVVHTSRHEAALELQTANYNVKKLQDEIIDKEKAIKELKDKKGTCPWCYGEVNQENVGRIVEQVIQAKEIDRKSLVELKEQIKQINISLIPYDEKLEQLQNVIDNIEDKQIKIQTKLLESRNQIHAFSKVREPTANSAQLLLEQQIDDLRKQAGIKKAELEGPSPFVEILKSAQQDVNYSIASCNEKEKQIKDEEATQPYYSYWINAFGDNGIRKFVIDGIIPALNSRITYWLEFLIDNKIELVFNNQLEESIKRNPVDGNPFVYHMLSKGQRQRLNLAVSQAFAYVMMINSGTSPSVVFLDEVTTNVDQQGVVGIYNMICELATEKQVFVTTHDQDLLSMLHGCQSINLEMRDGISKAI